MQNSLASAPIIAAMAIAMAHDVSAFVFLFAQVFAQVELGDTKTQNGFSSSYVSQPLGFCCPQRLQGERKTSTLS